MDVISCVGKGLCTCFRCLFNCSDYVYKTLITIFMLTVVLLFCAAKYYYDELLSTVNNIPSEVGDTIKKYASSLSICSNSLRPFKNNEHDF